MDQERKRDTAADLGGKAIAAVVGGSLGGPGGALASVALEPLLKHLVAESWHEIGALRQHSVGLMVKDAAVRLDVSAEELVARAWSNQQRTQLFADAMVQAAQTFNGQKIHALARAVANGLRGDEARADEERLIVSALASVEEAHIKVLLALPGRRSRPRVSSVGIRQRTPSRRGRSLHAVATDAHLSSGSAEHVMAELIRTGMAHLDNLASDTRHDKLIIELQQEVNKLQKITENPTKRPSSSNKPRAIKKPGSLPEPGYAMTRFGRLCLDYLQDLEPDPDDEEDDWPEPDESSPDGDGDPLR